VARCPTTDDDRTQEETVHDSVYPTATSELTRRRKQAAPEIHSAFQENQPTGLRGRSAAGEDQATDREAVAHVTQCPYCIRGHTRLAQRRGANEQEIMEAIWVAAEMRAGGAYAHSVLALDAVEFEGDGTATSSS